MNHHFHPFTPDLFKQETGMDASENEAIYFRWLNAHMNYANFQNLGEMTKLLKEMSHLLKHSSIISEGQRLT